MVRDAKTRAFLVRMAENERSMLDALAEVDGLAAADVVRLLIRKEYEARFPEKAKKSKK